MQVECGKMIDFCWPMGYNTTDNLLVLGVTLSGSLLYNGQKNNLEVHDP